MLEPQDLTYQVQAYNLSHASENKIHDDLVAQKLGFSGGLVPGVEVFAYASHPAVVRWGAAFLAGGWMSCRFAKPVYDGRLVTVNAHESDNGLQISVESGDSVCAAGEARFPGERSDQPQLADYQSNAPPDERPPADETSLASGRALETHPQTMTRDVLHAYLADARETATIFAEKGIAHPGYLLRLCNSALRDNVVLAPWIHTGSAIQFLSHAKVDDCLTVRARVVDNYERKGHRFVDLDCLVIANENRPVAHVLHTAIYRLRHLAE